MSILITGAAGYVGSVTARMIAQAGESVIALDNLQRGHLAALPPGVPFYRGDVGDVALVSTILHKHSVQFVLHFAAFAYVGESVLHPALYYENNVAQGLRLLTTLITNGVRGVVFSSSCATYGTAQTIPISESHRQRPLSPYGWSKLMLERALEDFDARYSFRSVILRYFNAGGATATNGEHHEPETHLIPSVLSVALGSADCISVYGREFPTQDGTAIRDYVHVQDLAVAHIKAIDYLRAGGPTVRLNLGTGHGHSVLEVVRTVQRVTGKDIPIQWALTRSGDPPALVAHASKANEVLGWQPTCSDIETIVTSAWRWHSEHPKGYPSLSPLQ
jgi:UDP-glucose-4-epimerase GalE